MKPRHELIGFDDVAAFDERLFQNPIVGSCDKTTYHRLNFAITSHAVREWYKHQASQTSRDRCDRLGQFGFAIRVPTLGRKVAYSLIGTQHDV